MAKIAHLTSVHKPFDTRIFHKQCKSLAEVGHEVILIAPTSSDDIIKEVQIVGVDPPRNRFIRVWRTARQVVQRARDMQVDVYHLHDPELLPWAWMLLDGKSAVIYDMHEDLVAQIRTKQWIPTSLRTPLSWATEIVMRILLKGYPVIFAELSYRDRYDWLQKTATVQNMPIVTKLTAIDEPKHSIPTLGYIGGVRPDRGSNLTLRAMKILQEEGYDIAWECVGPESPDHKQSFTELQSRLGVENVRRAGYLQPEQGWRRMARCHIGIAMLDKSPNFVGSYPTKLFEYMALGLPVVTSDIPMYREVVEQTGCGMVADPTSPEDFAEAIAKLLDDPDEARRMGKRGREAVKKSYSWTRERKKLVEFYDSSVLVQKNYTS